MGQPSSRPRNYLRMRGEETAGHSKPHLPLELPPHARRRAPASESKLAFTGNYLRMRGEERFPKATSAPMTELPPHARRRVETARMARKHRGITSACAEKRAAMVWHNEHIRNYLRMRGEEIRLRLSRKKIEELPPHARRRDTGGTSSNGLIGITSACAEKSLGQKPGAAQTGNYLRMRGEETAGVEMTEGFKELPPHARRRAGGNLQFATHVGITSACAEKRRRFQNRPRQCGNYLRMRGEERPRGARAAVVEELPPHARRRAAKAAVISAGAGITSACAEKRWRPGYGGAGAWNYLRMRGEETHVCAFAASK